MGYRSLRECVADLERTGQLVRLDDEIDPYLEAAEIQRRVYAAGGPAILYTRVKGCRFPMVSNLFGTIERARFLFRDMLAAVRHLVELKVDAASLSRWSRSMLVVISNGGGFLADHPPGRIDNHEAGHCPFEGIVGDQQRGPSVGVQGLGFGNA